MKDFFSRVKEVGPGAMVAASIVGPGTVTTCTITGASYGYTLLWTMLFSTLSVLVLQNMATRVGIVSKKGLGEAERSIYKDKKVHIFLAFIFVTAAIVGNTAFETSNLTGATLGMEAIFPNVGRNVWILILGIGGAILLFIGNFSYVEKFLTALVGLMGVLFFITAVAIRPDWGEVIKSLFIPRIPKVDRAWYVLTGLIGTTISPFTVFLQSSSAAKKWGDREDKQDAIATSWVDSIISLGMVFIISSSIVICAAAAFYGTGIEITNGKVMAESLTPILGNWATVVFGLGLWAAGFSSALTAPLSAAFPICGILGWGENVKGTKFRIIMAIVLGFGVFAGCFMGASPTEIILFAQVANAFVIPLNAILLVSICNNKTFMGGFTNKKAFNVFGAIIICITLAIAVRNISTFVDSLIVLFS